MFYKGKGPVAATRRPVQLEPCDLGKVSGNEVREVAQSLLRKGLVGFCKMERLLEDLKKGASWTNLYLQRITWLLG